MNTNKTYYIEDKEVDPKYGRIRMQHSLLLDGPIENYIKSEWFTVTDECGKEVNEVQIIK